MSSLPFLNLSVLSNQDLTFFSELSPLSKIGESTENSDQLSPVDASSIKGFFDNGYFLDNQTERGDQMFTPSITPHEQSQISTIAAPILSHSSSRPAMPINSISPQPPTLSTVLPPLLPITSTTPPPLIPSALVKTSTGSSSKQKRPSPQTDKNGINDKKKLKGIKQNAENCQIKKDDQLEDFEARILALEQENASYIRDLKKENQDLQQQNAYLLRIISDLLAQKRRDE